MYYFGIVNDVVFEFRMQVLSGQRLKGKSVGDRDMSLEFDDYVRYVISLTVTS